MKLGRKALAYLLSISMLASMMVTGISAEDVNEVDVDASTQEVQADAAQDVPPAPAGEDGAPLPVDEDGNPIAKEDNEVAPPPVDEDGNVIPREAAPAPATQADEDDGIAIIDADAADAAQPAASNDIALTSLDEADDAGVAAIDADEDYVAKIGDVGYGTLAKAITDAGTSETTITMTNNTTESVTIASGQTIILDLNGNTITGGSSEAITNNGTLTIKDESTSQTGKITASNQGIAMNSGTLNISGGTVESGTSYAIKQISGILNITDGTIKGSWAIYSYGTSVLNISGDPVIEGTSYGIVMGGTASLNVSGGTFSGGTYPIATSSFTGTAAISGGRYKPTSSFVQTYLAEGYVYSVVADSDGYYVVEAEPNVAEVDGAIYTDIYTAAANAAVPIATQGETLTLLDDVEITKILTIREGTTLDTGDYQIRVLENGTVMNATDTAIKVYCTVNEETVTIAAGDRYTAKDKNASVTEVSTAADLVTALRANDPHILLTADITLTEEHLVSGQNYVDYDYSGILDGNNNQYTLTFDFTSTSRYLISIPDNGLVIQDLDFKSIGGSVLIWYPDTTAKSVVFDNVVAQSSGSLISGTTNVSLFAGYNFGNILMMDCVNNQELEMTEYGAVFMGGAMNGSGTNTMYFVNCTNNADVSGQNTALLIGNPSNNAAHSAVTIYAVGIVNNGAIIGTNSAGIFQKTAQDSGEGTQYAELNTAYASAVTGTGMIGIADAYDWTVTMGEDGIISLVDHTTENKAVSYSIYFINYARTSYSTFLTGAVLTGMTETEFNAANIRYGKLMDITTFNATYPDIPTYTAPWSEFDTVNGSGREYEIAIIEGELYYIIDLSSAYALNTSPYVRVYAYDEDGIMVASTSLSAPSPVPSDLSIICTINDVAFFGTLAGAVTAAADGDTITLVADADETGIVSDKEITLDLNGYTLEIREGSVIANSGTLNITGEGYVKGTITNTTGTISISGGYYSADITGWAATGYEVTTEVIDETAYYTVQTAPEVVYTASGNTIYAKLDGTTVGKISVLAPTDLTYNGSAKTATIYDDNSGVLGAESLTITYSDTPTNAGTYTASITAQDLTASITFAISKAPVTVTVTNNSFEEGTYEAPSYELDPSVTYSVAYYDADGNEVTLGNDTAVGIYTIDLTITSPNHYLSGAVGSVVVYEGVKPTSNLSYDLDGGTGADNQSGVVVGTIITLDSPTKEDYAFTGWSYDGKIYAAGAEFIQPEENVVMTATWVLNSFTVSGTITDEEGTVVDGQDVSLQSLDGTEIKSTETASNGTFSFENVTMGEYNIVVTKDLESGATATTTTYIYVTGSTEIDKVMMDFTLSTSVNVAEELETTTVSGLETVASGSVSDVDAGEVETVEIKVTVTVASNDTALDAIAGASDDVGYTMDITVDMIVDEYEITPITETPALLSFTIDLPAEMQGMAYYTVLRYHEGSVDTLKTSKNRDGEYIELVYTTIDDVKVVTGIIIHAMYFSTYAITSSETVPSSGGVSYYTSSVASTSNGDVSLSATKATSGTTITITPTPDDGYAVDTVSVTYSSGKAVSVTDNGDGTYSYLQPGAAVTVSVTFVESDGTVDDDTFFIDVDTDDYFYEAVLWAVENGITAGTTDTTFSPNTVCNRAQAVTFLYRAAGEPSVYGDTAFTDLDEDGYYYDAVLWAVSEGITAGTTDTTFSAYNSCTRGQIVTFLYRAAGAPEVEGDALDVDADSYCYDAVIWAVENGITTGYTDGTFGANDYCTRAQIVTFLYRFLAE